jgi:anti-anti-sigma regulatory factor
LVPYLIINELRSGIVMSNQQIETAPPEVGAASEGTAGARESASPQAGTAGPGDFALALERDGSETAVLVLAGELDLYRAPAIEKALAEAIGWELDRDRCHKPLLGVPPGEHAQGLDGNVRHLAVDLRLVTFIDLTTLALLLAASRRQHAQGGQLLVLVGPQTPMTAFEVTGFDRLLAIRRLNDDPSTRRTGSSERIGLSPPPHMSLKGRNHDGISGNN